MADLEPGLSAAPVAAGPRPTPLRRTLQALRQRRWPPWLGAGLLLTTVLGCALFGGQRRLGTEICAGGRWFATGTEVVPWTDAGGYDAYQRGKHFTAETPPDGKRRYEPLRRDLPQALRDRLGDGPVPLAELQQVVHLLVLHFDVCGTSRQCFKVLQDVRNLSVHFLLDTDGTLYQTLDLQDTAWHATIANCASIGVEIAHPGVFRQPLGADMRRFYAKDVEGWRMLFPAFLGETGLRHPDYVPRPARPEFVTGEIHGVRYSQFDFTAPQYRALAHLCAALNRVFPRIKLQAPRDAAGRVLTTALPPGELLAFDGIVGHHHVQKDKQDPGPALQWDLLLQTAQALRQP